MTDSLLPRSEREQTDESLRLERERADRALDDEVSEADEKADSVISRARARADALLAAARSKTDQTSMIEMEVARENHAERVVSHARRVQRSGARMRRRVGDLVDVASIEAGMLAVTRAVGDPRTTVS
jgi:hypothetical protein